ncbi:MAG: hypothetical protein WC686_02525 [Candidatus Shapirobacteria bacterium]|jgi:pimeloyl-ACP methyl ester carboxylesterase
MNITKLRKTFVFLILLLSLTLTRMAKCYGRVYFEDNFERSEVGDAWEYVHGGGNYDNTWYVSDGFLMGEIGYEGSSYLFSKIGHTLSSYVVSLDVNNIRGVDQDILFGVNQDKSKYYILNFRYIDPYWGDNNMVRLWLFSDGSYQKIVEVTPAQLGNVFSLTQSVSHKVLIDVDTGGIQIFFDDTKIIDISGNELPTSYGIGFMNWAGSYYVNTVLNSFDNVKVTDKNPSGLRNKIIILPGLGASWNEGAMVFGQTVEDDDWKMTPFVSNYNGLITTLEGNGLIKNQDFYIWNYDWRKPVGDIVGKFDSFVEDKVEDGEKVDLIGHSLGGMVARVWGQEHPNDDRLGRVFTLGSPHFGAVKAYKAWNGGVVSDKFDFSSIAMKVALMLQKKNFETDMATVRTMAPVVKDLLPVFDFIKKGEDVIPYSDLGTVNDYILSKNVGMTELFPKFEAVVANGQLTDEWLRLTRRTVWDKMLGIWQDGRVTGSSQGEGDGTVLKKSAAFSDDSYYQIGGNHADMANNLADYLGDQLGLGVTGLFQEASTNWDHKLVFYLGSPATMTVQCDQGQEEAPEDGFVVIDHVGQQKCLVLIKAETDGIYHLVTGNSGRDDSWNYFEENLAVGQSRSLIISATTGEVEKSPGSEDLMFLQITNLLKKLKADYSKNRSIMEAVRAAERKDIDRTLAHYFKFSFQTGDFRGVDLVVRFSEMIIKGQAGSCDSRRLRPQIARMERLVKLAENLDLKDSPKIKAYGLMANWVGKLGEEVLTDCRISQSRLRIIQALIDQML